jgi:hypothetical protein
MKKAKHEHHHGNNVNCVHYPASSCISPRVYELHFKNHYTRIRLRPGILNWPVFSKTLYIFQFLLSTTYINKPYLKSKKHGASHDFQRPFSPLALNISITSIYFYYFQKIQTADHGDNMPVISAHERLRQDITCSKPA